MKSRSQVVELETLNRFSSTQEALRVVRRVSVGALTRLLARREKYVRIGILRIAPSDC